MARADALHPFDRAAISGIFGAMARRALARVSANGVTGMCSGGRG
jgi:hypothetical protein